MDAEATRTALAGHTTGEALDELRVEIDLTRVTGQRLGVDAEEVEREIRASLRRTLSGLGTPAESLQRLRSRWVA